MSRATVRIPAPLRPFTGGDGVVSAHGNTVREVLADLTRHSEGLAPKLLDERGELRSFINIFVDETNVRSLDGLDSPVGEGAVISIIPAVAGGVPSRRDRRLVELSTRIHEVTPREAFTRAQNGAVLVDIRESDEVAGGSPSGATRIVRGFLEMEIEDAVPNPDTPVLLLCAGGSRSLLAADDLERLGYRRVASVAGGFSQWKTDGLPIEVPKVLGAAQRERYARHVRIPEVGEAGQLKLLESRVLLVGAGGLGSPAALYLAAAGVGTIGLVDDDVVDRSNLQRQILHTDDRVGTPKVESARRAIGALNPDVRVVEHGVRLTRDNVEAIFGGYDIVVDGTDNFQTRYLVNDACVKLGIPNVHGSIFRFEGQVSVFWPGREGDPGPCYRCLFPEPPPPELAPSCADAGVLGVLPGVVGTLEAVEAIKLILGAGEPLVGRLLQYDALTASFHTYRVDRNPECRYCGDHAGEFPGYADYDRFCAAVSS